MMKKFKLGKLFTAVCALLAFVLVFSFAACDTGGEGGSNGLTLNSYSLSIDVGKSNPLLVTSTVTEDVIWTSSDESKVTVSGSGMGNRAGTVQAVAIGTATITAKSGDKFATCTVTVVEAETITVTKDGSAVTSVSLSGKDSTVQLAAKSSRDHAISWESDKPLIAEVSENGLVTAVASSGTAVITAKCAQHSDVLKTVTVVIGSGADASYEIKQGDENGQFGNPYNSNANPGVWIYWNQYNNVIATYEEGVVNIETTGVNEGALWYNVQLFYTATANDKDVAGNALTGGTLYELTFDMETTMAGHITVNGYVVELQEGLNHCTAYYEHKATAFSMQLGVDGVGCDITNATLKLSNIKWKVSEPIQLVAPTFSIGANNVITITDPNAKGVGSYTLNLYNDSGVRVGGIVVKNNQTVNTDRITENGTYTAQIIANAANANYITSPESNVTSNNSIVVNHKHSVYDIISGGAGSALAEAGTWAYWTESWVKFSGSVTDGVAKVTFSNNSGNWYDTQLFYKIPNKNAGDAYSVKLHINNVPNAGRVTINGQVITLAKDDNVIDLNIKETDGASITIVFGVDPEHKKQEIQAAENLEIFFELV